MRKSELNFHSQTTMKLNNKKGHKDDFGLICVHCSVDCSPSGSPHTVRLITNPHKKLNYRQQIFYDCQQQLQTTTLQYFIVFTYELRRERMIAQL